MLKSSYYACCFVLWALLTLPGNAQNQLHVSRYTTEQGLSQDAIRAIYQDHLGYIWIGTEEGLNRFDGKTFKQFRHQSSNKNSISSDLIYAVTGDKQGDLWIGTKGRSGGLNKYIYDTNQFVHYQHSADPRSISGNNITSLFIDSSGNLWIGTEKNGVNLLLSESNGGIFKRITSDNGLTSNAIRTLAEDDLGNIWVGTEDKGISLIRKDTLAVTKHYWNTATATPLSSNAIRSIIKDNRGNMLVGTAEGGLNRYLANERKFEVYRHNTNPNSLSSDRVISLYQDASFNIWVGTEEGLNLFDDGKFVSFKHLNTDIHSLSNNRILSIFQDRGGILWVGSYSGLNKWNPQRAYFNHVRYSVTDNDTVTTANVITHFSKGVDGTVYVSTYGGGLMIYDQKSEALRPVSLDNALQDNRVMTSLLDSNNNLWLGTRNSGISLNKSGENRWQHLTTENGLPSNGVTDILEDKQGAIWVSTYRGGLCRWDNTSNSFKPFALNEEDAPIKAYQIVENSDSTLWLVTGNGLYQIDYANNTTKSYTDLVDGDGKVLTNNYLYLHIDPSGNFWLATHGGGLIFWPKKNREGNNLTAVNLTIDDGLSSNTVYGITEDSLGNIWFSTNKGINRLTPATNQFKHYDKSHGLQENDFNLAAVIATDEGNLLFGGPNGFNVFDPLSVKDNLHPPQVQLSQVLSLNKPLSLEVPNHKAQAIAFNYDDYLIAFDYVGLDFTAPEKNRYQYMLRGFDPDWIDAGEHTRATYTNLPAGNYVFSVKAANNDGVWSDASLNIAVTVHAAFWKTWWAYLVYILVFSLFIYLILRNQANKLSREESFNHQLSLKMQTNEKVLEDTTNALIECQQELEKSQVVDSATGFKTPAFLTHYLPLRIAKINEQFQGKSALDIANGEHNKLFIAIIRFNETTANIDVLAEQTKRLTSSVLPHDVLVHWANNEFVILGERTTNKAIESVIRNTSASLHQQGLKHHIGFSRYPFDELTPLAFSWEQVSLIANQALNHAEALSNLRWLGVLGCKCETTEWLFADIMKSKNLTLEDELLQLSQDDED